MDALRWMSSHLGWHPFPYFPSMSLLATILCPVLHRMLTALGRVREHTDDSTRCGSMCCTCSLCAPLPRRQRRAKTVTGCMLPCRGHEVALGDNQKVTRQKKRRYNEINHVTSVSYLLFALHHTTTCGRVDGFTLHSLARSQGCQAEGWGLCVCCRTWQSCHP